MFLSVKERARQIANGQFQPSQAPTSEQVAPPSKTLPPKVITTKFSPAKVSKTATSPTTPSKKSSTKTERSKIESPKITSPKLASSKTASSKTTSSKTASEKTASSSSKSSSKTSSSKDPKSPKLPSSPKIATPKRSSSPKIASPKVPSSKPSRSKQPSNMGIGSFAEEPSDDEISELKAACLKEVNGVTGLGGKRLVITLKQRSSSSEWYAALKDTSSDKYLKMWMNRDKTFPTQKEALEAYLVFVKKMKTGYGFLPMSPKTSKTK